MVDADLDGRKDLLAGEAEGNIRLYRNINTDEEPEFDAGTLLEAGPAGSRIVIDVGQRTTPVVVDWDLDGRRDLLVGSKDGFVHLFRNTGTDAAWEFAAGETLQADGADLVVPSLRASPHVLDFDGDGRRDLLLGNTEGQILFYPNVGTDAEPSFAGYTFIESDGVPIDLPGTPRSRPFLCDWNEDGITDMLVGSGDGLVRLYLGADELAGGCECGPPTASRLLKAWPNPFNPLTTIAYETETAGRVRVSIFDAAGRLVRILVDESRPAGRHEAVWNGSSRDGRAVASGVYYCRFEANGSSNTTKLILLR